MSDIPKLPRTGRFWGRLLGFSVFSGVAPVGLYVFLHAYLELPEPLRAGSFIWSGLEYCGLMVLLLLLNLAVLGPVYRTNFLIGYWERAMHRESRVNPAVSSIVAFAAWFAAIKLTEAMMPGNPVFEDKTGLGATMIVMICVILLTWPAIYYGERKRWDQPNCTAKEAGA
jgi:hypothetical protein